jgi:hypothetical protein
VAHSLNLRRAHRMTIGIDPLQLDAARVMTDGDGASKPVAPNRHSNGSDNPDGRAKNPTHRSIAAMASAWLRSCVPINCQSMSKLSHAKRLPERLPLANGYGESSVLQKRESLLGLTGQICCHSPRRRASTTIQALTLPCTAAAAR